MYHTNHLILFFSIFIIIFFSFGGAAQKELLYEKSRTTLLKFILKSKDSQQNYKNQFNIIYELRLLERGEVVD